MAALPTPCTLCGGTGYDLVHDMGWRRILRCAGCRLVRADPLPSLAEKAIIETQGYTDETAFPEVRDFFANCHRNFVEDPVIREMRRHLERLERITGGPGKLLDIGAGTGILMHLARERGWQVQGIDICSLTAEKAAREFGVEVVVAPIEEHGFADRFDAITMLDVLEHVVDPLATLRRAYDLLRPGGAIAIAVPNQRCLLTSLVGAYARVRGPAANGLLFRLYVPQHLHYFTPPTLRRMVETAKFRIRELRQGAVYLGRYRMSLAMRIPLEMVLAAGAAIGMNARLAVLAVKD
ncbi:MAG: class I SAM-dependent methyltransferase [Deltaproteobacteria bacterium]|nr:class I SAM-dependent methyltransferase [Deltaproteobacteria bacterium]